MTLVLPDVVLRRLELEAGLEKLGRLRERAGWLREFDSALKGIDGQLSLVRARGDALAPGLIPGFWHVKRSNPVGVDSFLAIMTPDGEFCEPHSGVLEDLRRWDLQRPGALEELRDRQAREVADRAKGKQLAHEERLEELVGRMKAIDSPGVRFGGSWTARASARNESGR